MGIPTPILTTLALAVFAGPAIGQTGQDELSEALVGNTFQGDMGGGAYSSYFAEDGTYYDASGSGPYEITADGVCYPETDFGCYQAEISGETLEWFQDGESQGTGQIIEGNPMDF